MEDLFMKKMRNQRKELKRQRNSWIQSSSGIRTILATWRDRAADAAYAVGNLSSSLLREPGNSAGDSVADLDRNGSRNNRSMVGDADDSFASRLALVQQLVQQAKDAECEEGTKRRTSLGVEWFQNQTDMLLSYKVLAKMALFRVNRAWGSWHGHALKCQEQRQVVRGALLRLSGVAMSRALIRWQQITPRLEAAKVKAAAKQAKVKAAAEAAAVEADRGEGRRENCIRRVS